MPDNTRLLTPFADTAVAHDASDEYNLPDYYPEIRRILAVTARAIPDSKYISDGKIEWGGTCAFTVTYVGDDGKIASVSHPVEYSASSAFGGGKPSCVTVDTHAENPACRVTAPRKVSLKAKLRSRILADASVSCEDKIAVAGGGRVTPADEMALERRSVTAPTCIRRCGTYTGTADGVIPTEGKLTPIIADGTVSVTSARAEDDFVTLRGTAAVTAVCITEDGRYVTLRGKCDIDDSIPADGVREGDIARGWGIPASVSASADDGVVKWEMEYDVTAEALARQSADVTADIYSTEYATVPAFADVDVLSPVACGGAFVSADGSAQGEGAVVASFADAQVDKIECAKGRVSVSGTCAVKAILRGEEISVADISVPFKCDLDGIGDGATDMITRCDACVTDISVKSDGGKVTANCEISVSLTAMGKTRMRTVAETVIDRSAPVIRRDAEIRVYYPEEGDTAWSVAKKYHASMGDFIRQNGEELTDAPVIV